MTGDTLTRLPRLSNHVDGGTGGRIAPVPMPSSFASVRRVATPTMRRLFVGQLLNSVGSGLTLSLVIVYLHSVRGLPVSTATVLLAWQSVLALALSPIAGTLVDRVGPRPVLLTAILIEGGAILSLGHVTTRQAAFVAMSAISVGGAGIWGPQSALVARLVPSADRATAFGVSFMLTNLGLGLGGLIAATIIDLADPGTFTLLYTLDAVAFLAYFVAVLSLGNVGGMPEPEAQEGAPQPGGRLPARPTGGWAEVLRDRTLLQFATAGLLMLTFGYGSIDAGLSLFITDAAGLPEHYIGIVFACNTMVIVLMQLVVLSVVHGRSRSRLLGGVAVLWGVSWLLFGAALGLPEWGAVLLVIAGISVFAVGETLWSPVAPALLNDLAPEHLRGRYNAFQSLLWGVSGALGPLLTGAFLAGGQARLWTGSLTIGCAVAALLAWRLQRRITPEQDGRSASEPAVGVVA